MVFSHLRITVYYIIYMTIKLISKCEIIIKKVWSPNAIIYLYKDHHINITRSEPLKTSFYIIGMIILILMCHTKMYNHTSRMIYI